MIPIPIPWKDETSVAEVEPKRPSPEVSALTCPAQQSMEVIGKHTHLPEATPPSTGSTPRDQDLETRMGSTEKNDIHE
jgi:hypothetical protein